MKIKALFTFIVLCNSALSAFAQNTEAIEADLLKSFRQIKYWDAKISDTTLKAEDSLDKANDSFTTKLQQVTEQTPATLKYSFSLLRKEYLNICTSADGLFRIYSWDTEGGGTMHEFENVMQYKARKTTYSIIVSDTPLNSVEKYVPYYSKIYSFMNNGKTYYLSIFEGVYCSGCRGAGIQIFTIENGKLNDDVKLFKTKTGLHSQLYYEYDLYSVINQKVKPKITFNLNTKILHLPVVIEQGKVTRRYITYKFTGKYFERAKG